jgi:hypothetical protein
VGIIYGAFQTVIEQIRKYSEQSGIKIKFNVVLFLNSKQKNFKGLLKIKGRVWNFYLSGAMCPIRDLWIDITFKLYSTTGDSVR